MHPQVLLLDDPTVGIAKEISLQFFDLVSDLRSQGVCRHIFMSSFDQSMVDILRPVEIGIDNGQLHQVKVDPEKQAVNL